MAKLFSDNQGGIEMFGQWVVIYDMSREQQIFGRNPGHVYVLYFCVFSHERQIYQFGKLFFCIERYDSYYRRTEGGCYSFIYSCYYTCMRCGFFYKCEIL